jgi:anti-sigma factor RsiW
MSDFWNRLFGRGRRNGDGVPLACQELVELVTDYLEGALSDADRARFEAHIAGCDACTMYVQQMREMLVAVGSLSSDSLSPEVEAELLAAFRGWKGSSS